MVDIDLILIVLKAQILSGKHGSSISKHLNFTILQGSLRLGRLKRRLPPTFPVGMSISKLIDSTEEAKVGDLKFSKT